MNLVFVLYDSIHHSIFEGQVLAPLVKQYHAGIYQRIEIVSFEETLSPEVFAAHTKYARLHPWLTITLFKRPRFLCKLLLLRQILQLRPFFTCYLQPYHVIARGPLAGLIAQHAVTKLCVHFTIQARGLLAEEHAYTHKNDRGLFAFLHRLRTRQLFSLEKNAYTPPQKKKCPFSIEAVSPALQTYLAQTYAVPNAIFTSPIFDTPECITPEEKTAHRKNIRTLLHINAQAPVYVYNGSLKPWQCPQETIDFFKEKLTQDGTSIFLGLTQDDKRMQLLLQKAGVPERAYRVISVPQSEVIRYLCAADYGMLLREAHIVNWVSRPTKMLEYQAAGLKIIHNNTIQLLAR